MRQWIKIIIRQARGGTAQVIGYTLGSKVVAHAFAIISGVLIARHLGPEGKGILTVLFIIPSFISSCGHFGLPVSNIYFLGKNKDKETLFINSLSFILIASIVYIFGSFIAMPLLNKSYFSGISSFYLVCSVLVMIPLLLTKHFFIDFLRGFEKYKEFNYTNLSQHGLRLSLLLLFIYFSWLTVELALTAVVISLFLSNVYSYIIIKKEVPIRTIKANRIQFRENLSYGLREYIGNLFGTLNIKIDLLVLAAFMDKGSIGIYSVVMAISGLFEFIPSSIGVVLLPKISKASPENVHTILRKSIVFNALLLSIGWLSFIIIGRQLIPFLYGEQFSSVYSLTIIVLFGSILLSFTQIMNKYFSGIGRPEIKSIISGVNIPIKAVSLYILVNSFGLEGAAWSFVITTASLLLLTLYGYHRAKKNIISTS